MNLTNEPYVTGGNPVIAGSRQGAGAKVLFNDILGTSQGAANGEKYSAIKRDSFGEVLDNSVDGDYDYFTGKPMVEGLGYAFLFRSYQAGLGKWTTSDPLGYPDGWNNFAYCNNMVTTGVDWLGGETLTLIPIDPQAQLLGDLGIDYEAFGDCQKLQGTANFAVTFESGTFTGWTNARTAVTFSIKNIDTGTTYSCNGSLSANIAKSGSEYIVTGSDGKRYRAQNYLLTINISISGAGTTLSNSTQGFATGYKLIEE